MKNHRFIIDLMPELLTRIPECRLLVVGSGPMEVGLKKYCSARGLDGAVVFTGARTDIERFYQAMDICAMPSVQEGFPMVAVEALAAGLPLVLSEHITKELRFGKKVSYLPLERRAWIEKLSQKILREDREQGVQDIWDHGFEIRNTVKVLERIYLW